MAWFRKKASIGAAVDPAHTKEIAIHKDAVKEAAEEASKASLKLNTLIENNGFTVIIAASMGAKHTRRASYHGH